MKPPKKLLNQWNRKLKASGFTDIETSSHRLKDHHADSFSRITKEEFDEKQKYFSLAQQLASGYEDEYGNWVDVFEGKEGERAVWLFFCKGMSEKDIALKLKLHRNTVSRIIKKYNEYIINV